MADVGGDQGTRWLGHGAGDRRDGHPWVGGDGTGGIEREGFDEEQQAAVKSDGVTNELYHRLAAARTYLKAAGAIESSQRGVWALTEPGRGMSEADIQGISGVYQRQAAERRRKAGQGESDEPIALPSPDETDVQAGAEGEEDWREQLLQRLLQLEPAALSALRCASSERQGSSTLS